MPKPLPPLDVLREHLDFHPDGTITLRKKRSSKGDHKNVGERLGGVTSKGYLRLSLSNKSYLVHRLVFYNFNGWCPANIDHIDGDKTNNRPENLRAADNRHNQANQPKKRTYAGRQTSASLKGVRRTSPNTWVAMAKVSGKQTYLGSFRSEAEAHKAYCDAASKEFGEFFRSQ